MKHSLKYAAFILALTLNACSSNAAPTPIPTIVLSSNAASTANAVTASGEILPMPKAQLSFPLTGTVKTVAVKAGDAVRQGQTLVILDSLIWQAKVQEAEANLAASQADEKYAVRVGEDQEQINSAMADVQSNQAALDAANETLAQATLTAPFNGTVASVDINPGETVTEGQEVVMLGELSNFQVETTDLSERDAPQVQVGQSASVTVKALNAEFPARVIQI